MKQFFADCHTMTSRDLRLSFRNLDAVIMSIMMPAMMMILFVFMFGGAMDIDGKFGGIKYVNYIVPAVIVLSMCQAAMSTATIVCIDMQNGMVDRIRSMAVSNAAFLIGHVITSVIRNIVSTIIVFGVAFAVGFRPVAGFVDWLAVIGILIVFMFIMAWISVLFGLLAKSPEGASGYMMIFFFLPYLSSGFVPTNTMPIILRQISQHQPMTPIIETLRSLFLGLNNAQWLITILWGSGLLVAGYILSLLAFKHRTR